MINNNYNLSLQLYLRLQDIDSIMKFAPLLKSGIKKFYEEEFCPAAEAIKNTELEISHRNYEVPKSEFDSLWHKSLVFESKIAEALSNEQKRNAFFALGILKDEVRKLVMLLFQDL